MVILFEKKGQQRKIRSFFSTSVNDIAVVTLDTPIDLEEICATPLCLDPTFEIKEDMECTVAGWGLTQGLFVYVCVLLCVCLCVYSWMVRQFDKIHVQRKFQSFPKKEES